MKHIPNAFTLLNLVFGCCAIVFCLQNGISIQDRPDGIQLIEMPEKIVFASLFIGLAAIVDFLDGFVARWLKATSALGQQLDSLADVVSFGVAPSMILYQFLRMSFASQENGLNVPIIYLMPAFILAAAAAYRLGKFNLDETQSVVFKGVPTPAVGLMIASFPLIYWYPSSDWVVNGLLNKWVLYSMIFLLSYLMICELPIMSLKFKSLQLKDNLPKLILLALSITLFFVFHWTSVPVIFFCYILLSLIFKKNII